MPRDRASQAKHDRSVRQFAENLENLGFTVKADVEGYARPTTVLGYRPDVVAQKGRERRIIEVETPDSVNSARDRAQQFAFRRAVNRSKYTTFIRKVAE